MVEKFHDELQRLKDDMLTMGFLALEMLSQSLEALEKQDAALARSVVDRKRELTGWDERNEEAALRLIALYQPMAGDLRTIATSLKMVTYLTRIGSYGKDIAKAAERLAEEPQIGGLLSIPHMGEIVRGMIGGSLKAFETGDLSFVNGMSKRDDQVDDLRTTIFRESVTRMMEDPATISRCTDYVMIARYLERCGDHACKIAEKVHFMVTGERVEIT
ncbi:MAG: phosphate signaling complex protein PhoU [Methanomicrobiales archaeon]|nr:phosphate signaling complex protein PhoU [Methanomicrobiales archaeon]